MFQCFILLLIIQCQCQYSFGDDITGLTSNEKRLVKDAWDLLMKDSTKYGIMIFKNFFEKDPSYINYFSFKNETFNELINNKRFIEHVDYIMHTFKSIIDNLEDNPKLSIATLQKKGKSHKKTKTIPFKTFPDLRDSILSVVTPLVDDETNKAVEKFLELFLKIIQQEFDKMGVIYSLFGWNNPGETDPILGITDREKKLIHTSWTKLMEDSSGNGSIIMISFFTKYPEYKKLFPFKDVPMDEINNDSRFKVHCNTVMYNLSQIVNNLNDSELIIAMLDKLAINHKKHGATPQGFDDIKGVILEILQKFISKETYDAWEKLLNVAMSHISKQL